jgi:hypothetical protein
VRDFGRRVRLQRRDDDILSTFVTAASFVEQTEGLPHA